MIYIKHLKQYIIKPYLEFLGLHSGSAENLVLGTIAVESNLGFYLHQVDGIAYGICQMEPNTHHDIWHFFLSQKKRLVLKNKIFAYFNLTTRPAPEKMIYDLRYAVVMCRLRYLMVEEQLPASSDVEKLAKYWKKYYNTRLGSGTVDKFIFAYHKFVL